MKFTISVKNSYQFKALTSALLFVLMLSCFVGLVEFPAATAQTKTYLKSFVTSDSYLKIPSFSFADSIVSSASKSSSYQFNVTLNKPIVGNVLSIPLETYGLEFYYQPALSDELDAKDFDFVNATHAIRKGIVAVYRPENVVGSYAVYKSAIKGGETGKLYHIYAPLLVDAKGVTSWANLNVTKNSLNIVMDKAFLDGAVYPVVVDPTFGYTTAGASQNSESNYIIGSIFSLNESCIVSKLTMYARGYGGQNVAGAIYDSSHSLVATTVEANAPANAWTDLSFNSPPSLTVGNYWLVVNTAANFVGKAYDSGDANQGVQVVRTYTSGFPASFTEAGWNRNAKYSIYATYTATSNPENISVTLNQPSNASTINAFGCNFNFTPTLLGLDSFKNASLYINGVSVANNASALTNATLNMIAYTFTANGTYLWDIRVFNSTAGVFSSNGNFSLTVAVYVANTYYIDVVIVKPENTTYTTNSIPVNLTITTNGTNPIATWNIRLANASWLYGSNQTFSVATTASINENLTATFFVWTVNSEGSTDNGNVTFSVTIITVSSDELTGDDWLVVGGVLGVCMFGPVIGVLAFNAKKKNEPE